MASFMSAFLAFPPAALAGNSLYDMRSLLAQPHPFASAAPSPAAAAQVPAAGPDRGTVAPPIATGENETSKEEEPLDLDELPGAKDTESGELDVNDPLEPLNRAIFGFNEIFNYFILEPVARTYNFVTPEFVRVRIGNFFTNIKSPVVLVNDLLQGEFERGLDIGARLIVNSTIGLAGFFDVAGEMGLKPHTEDFGQTLAVWGVGEGFYLVLPLLGPSNPRDALGKFVVDSFFDPLGYYVDNTGRDDLNLALAGVRGVTTYAEIVEELGDLRETSIDFYGALRSLFRQRRLAEINNSDGGAVPIIDSYSK
ncbi:MAG: VacJ family lipoprotein [Pseudomonadota bacterium]|nr:VacJ family lipoprotein [Pseudomonadota bacterium]